MKVLIDSSVWIEYFRGDGSSATVDLLIEENLLVTNDLILAELIPSLTLKRQSRLVGLLKEIERLPISIEWDEIIEMQILCLRKGINGIGIPDLIIAQNVMQNPVRLLSRDRHFALMSEYLPIDVY